MSGFAIALLRIGFLVLLWVFVLALALTLRRDVNGTQVRDRRFKRAAKVQPAPQPASAPRAAPQEPRHTAQPHVPTLVVTDGALAGTTLPLSHAPLVIGRSPDCALVLADNYSSSRHARIFPADGSWWVEDLDSTNGTFVGGHRISSPTQLRAGTPVVVGKTTLELRP
ncbi:FHA domain-containing protein [Arcanobacterium haemolyticum]|nr:FHA domain-containing protein [Arcanobacterium haemolyticum]